MSDSRDAAVRLRTPCGWLRSSGGLAIAGVAVVGLLSRRGLAVLGGGYGLQLCRAVVKVMARGVRVLVTRAEEQVGGHWSFALDLDRAAWA
jgi:hypothetical protein